MTIEAGQRYEVKPRHWVEITRVDGDEVYFTYCSMPMWARLGRLTADLSGKQPVPDDPEPWRC